MYKNLKFAMREKGVTYRMLGDAINRKERTIWDKMNGKSNFTEFEQQIITRDLFPEKNISELFAKGGE